MKPLWNLTLHEHGPREIMLAASFGFALGPAMRGVEVPRGQGGLESAVERLVATLCACEAAGAAALIGGHTGLWVAAIMAVQKRSLTLPELYCFETRRLQDENGRFRFEAEGLLGVGPGLLGNR